MIFSQCTRICNQRTDSKRSFTLFLLIYFILVLLCPHSVLAEPPAEIPSSISLPSPGQNNLWYWLTDSDTVLVFVHGILSDSRSCWLYDKDGEKYYWPELIRTDPRPNFSWVSIYLAGYYTATDSGEYGLRNAADEVFAALKRPDEQGHPPVMTKKNLVFIGHSTGGVVIQRILESNSQAFVDKTVGVVLIASPSYGSHIANYLDPLAMLYDQRLGQELKWRSWNLEDLDDRFRNLLNNGPIHRLVGIEAYENHFIVHNKWLPFWNSTYLVSKESAGRYFGAPVMLRDTDHFSTVKPRARTDPGYELLYDFYTEKFSQLVARPEDAESVPNVFEHPGGRYVKEGDWWVEYPPYEPGRYLRHREYWRDGTYIYLSDDTRHREGDPTAIVLTRLPIKGGPANWSWSHPIAWGALFDVTPKQVSVSPEKTSNTTR